MPKMNVKTNAKRLTRIRRKRDDLFAGKTVRKDSLGKECFDDYFTDHSQCGSPRRRKSSSNRPNGDEKSSEQIPATSDDHSKSNPNESGLNINVETSRTSLARASKTPKATDDASSATKCRKSIFSAETVTSSSPRTRLSTQARTRLSFENDEVDVAPNRSDACDRSISKCTNSYATICDHSALQLKLSSVPSTSKDVDVIDDDDIEIDEGLDDLKLDLRSAKTKLAKEVVQERFSDDNDASDLNKSKTGVVTRKESVPSTSSRKRRSTRRLVSESSDDGGSDSSATDIQLDEVQGGSFRLGGSLSRVERGDVSAVKATKRLTVTKLRKSISHAGRDTSPESEVFSVAKELTSAEQNSAKSRSKSGRETSAFVNLRSSVSPTWPSPWKVISVVADAGVGASSSECNPDDPPSNDPVREVANKSDERSFRSVNESEQVPLDQIQSTPRHSRVVLRSSPKAGSSPSRHHVETVPQSPKEFASSKGNLKRGNRRSLARPSSEPLLVDTSAVPKGSSIAWGRMSYMLANGHVSSQDSHSEDSDELLEENEQRRTSRKRLADKAADQTVKKLNNSIHLVASPKASSTFSVLNTSKRRSTRDEDQTAASPPKSSRLVEPKPGPSNARKGNEQKKRTEMTKNSPLVVRDCDAETPSKSLQKSHRNADKSAGPSSIPTVSKGRRKHKTDKNPSLVVEGESDVSKQKGRKNIRSKCSGNEAVHKSNEPTVDEQQPGPSGIKKKNNRLDIETRNSLYFKGHGKRNRMQPLEFWRNERPVYKRNSKGLFTFVKVDEGFAPIPTYQSNSERRKMMKNKKTVKERGPVLDVHDTEVETEEEELDSVVFGDDCVSNTLNPIGVINPMTGEEVFIDCVKVEEGYRYNSITGQMPQPDEELIVAKPLMQKAFSSGIIRLNAGAEKGMTFLVKDTMVFWVIRGTLEVTIHETTVIVSKQDSFFVPHGGQDL